MCHKPNNKSCSTSYYEILHKAIRAKLQEVWADATRVEPRRRRGRPRKQTAQPNTNIDKARERDKEIVERGASDRVEPTPDQRANQIQVRSQIKKIGDELREEWKRRWESQAAKPHRHARTWKEGWLSMPTRIYDGVRKHVATAIFLPRSEVLGLRAWLSVIGVPDRVFNMSKYGFVRVIVLIKLDFSLSTDAN